MVPVPGHRLDVHAFAWWTSTRRWSPPTPRALAAALVSRFGWEADFALANARKGLKREDVNYLGGCAFRAVSAMVQTVFAVNREYCLNEKGAVGLVDGLPEHPPAFRVRVEEALRLLPGPAPQDGLEALGALDREVQALLGAHLAA